MKFNNAMPSWKQATYQHKQAQQKPAKAEQAPQETPPPTEAKESQQENLSTNDNGLLVHGTDTTTNAVYSLVANGTYDLAALMAVQAGVKIIVTASNLANTVVTGADDKKNQVIIGSSASNATVNFTGGALNDAANLFGSNNHLTAVLGASADSTTLSGTNGSSAEVDMGTGNDSTTIAGSNSNYVVHSGEGADNLQLGTAENITAEIFLGPDGQTDKFTVVHSGIQKDNTITIHGDDQDSLAFPGYYSDGPWPKNNTFFTFSGTAPNQTIEFGDGNKLILDGVSKVSIDFDDGTTFNGTVDELNLLLNPIATGPDPSEVFNYTATSGHDYLGGSWKPSAADAAKEYWNIDLKEGNDSFTPNITTMKNKTITMDAGAGNDKIYFTNSQYVNNTIDIDLGTGIDNFMLGRVKEHTGTVNLGVDNDEDLVYLSNMALQKDNQLTLVGDAKDLVSIPANDLTTITDLTQSASGEWQLSYGDNNVLTIPADMKIRVGNTDRTLQEFMEYLLDQGII